MQGPELKEAAELLAAGSSRLWCSALLCRTMTMLPTMIGTIKPVVDEVFKFEDALKAYERSMSGR
jgi:hypothetical protein